MSEIILFRLLMMLIYIFIGFVLYKKTLISDESVADMGKILVNVILPAAVIKSYNIELTHEKTIGLLCSFFAAILALILSIIASRLFFKNDPIESFGVSFSNAGFMGIPLVQSVLGEEAVIYAASFVAILNILQWTYGVYIMTGDYEAVSVKKIFTSPIVISFFIGAVLCTLPFGLPAIASDILNGLSGMNAPLAMLIIGAYMAQVSPRELFTESISYKASILRLIVIPFITILLFAVLPLGSEEMKRALIILASAPIGSNVAIYAQLHNCDYRRAVKDVVLSTLLSVLCMPAVIGISEYILQRTL